MSHTECYVHALILVEGRYDKFYKSMHMYACVCVYMYFCVCVYGDSTHRDFYFICSIRRVLVLLCLFYGTIFHALFSHCILSLRFTLYSCVDSSFMLLTFLCYVYHTFKTCALYTVSVRSHVTHSIRAKNLF